MMHGNSNIKKNIFSYLFLPLTPLFIFCFVMQLVALVSHIYYFSVYFYHHQFHFQTDSTAPFYIRSGQAAVFLLLIIIFRLFKPTFAVLRYGLLLIPSGFDFCLKIFLSWHLYSGSYTQLCFNLLIGTNLSLYS